LSEAISSIRSNLTRSKQSQADVGIASGLRSKINESPRNDRIRTSTISEIFFQARNISLFDLPTGRGLNYPKRFWKIYSGLFKLSRKAAV
jgi:hypothetical protein